MRLKLSALFVSVFAVSGWSVARAQNVTITPLGAQQGEFCVGDRALLFQDPTGVRILTAPGRTVNGSTDPRLPNPADPSGGVHVVLIDHPHGTILEMSSIPTAPARQRHRLSSRRTAIPPRS